MKSVMILKLFVAATDPLQLIEEYKISIQKHNDKLQTDAFMDAGFDILNPSVVGKCCSHSYGLNKIDFQIKCSAYMVKIHDMNELTALATETTTDYTAYYMYPRSSLSKTPLRLANHVGIIDSGYRGNLIGMFDCKSNEKSLLCEGEYDYIVKPFEKLLQICAPNLCPIYVIMVNTVEELSPLTSRGSGGFGSTTS